MYSDRCLLTVVLSQLPPADLGPSRPPLKQTGLRVPTTSPYSSFPGTDFRVASAPYKPSLSRSVPPQVSHPPAPRRTPPSSTGPSPPSARPKAPPTCNNSTRASWRSSTCSTTPRARSSPPSRCSSRPRCGSPPPRGGLRPPRTGPPLGNRRW
jgi:hypothetical protein